MEKSSELLIRSALHDIANILSGVRGILDLSLPDQPLSQRDRGRLDAVLEEGITLLERTRHLAMDTLPEAPWEAGASWREQLQAELEPLATLFRCRIEVGFDGAAEWDEWPGPRLRGYIRALTRQVLPYAKAPTLSIRASAGPEGWRLRWSPASALPENPDTGRPVDICGHWAARLGAALGATLTCDEDGLLAVIPRP